MSSHLMLDEQGRELAGLCGLRAENIYAARDYCCAEAVLATLCRGFGAGLDEEEAARLGSGFCKGMGGAGCVCGALAAGQIVLSLLLGPRSSGGLSKKEFAPWSRELHDRFKARFKATCCRGLLALRRSKRGAECRELTGGAAELAAMIVLAIRPEFAAGADREFLEVRETVPAAGKK